MIQIRKLAAVDLAYLGPRIILPEFAFGVIGPLVLGTLTLWRAHSLGGRLFGAYLIMIGINYLPLLIHAIDIARQDSALRELEDEPHNRRELFWKYRRESLWILVPLAIAFTALVKKTKP
jgi:hypothetical protein